MDISPVQDIVPVTLFKKNMKQIFDQVHSTGRPVYLTVNGKADAVLVDPEAWEKQLKIANFSRLLAESEADVAAGRTKPLRQFVKEWRDEKKIRGRNKRKRPS